MLQDNRALVGTSTPEMLAPLSDPDFPSLIQNPQLTGAYRCPADPGRAERVCLSSWGS